MKKECGELEGFGKYLVRETWDKIYHKSTKTPFDDINDIKEEMELQKFCDKYSVPYKMVNNMLFDEKDLSKYARRKDIHLRLKKSLETHSGIG